MKITEVRVKLVDRQSDRLKAFCTVTFDDEFVVRDLKVIEGPDGFFIAMPSRKLTDHCPKCGAKNHLRASYCNECGARLSAERCATDEKGRAKLHADVAHPINARCREKVQEAVVEAYREELEASQQPGYRPRSLEVDDDDDYADLVRSLNRPGEGASNSESGGTQAAEPANPKPGDDESNFGAGIL